MESSEWITATASEYQARRAWLGDEISLEAAAATAEDEEPDYGGFPPPEAARLLLRDYVETIIALRKMAAERRL